MKGFSALFLFFFLLVLQANCAQQPSVPLPKTEKPFYVVWIADTHLGFRASNNAFADFLKDVASLPFKPDLLINSGDVAEIGDTASDQRYLSGIQSLGIPSVAIIGNHDTRWCATGKRHFETMFGRRYFSEDLEGIHWMFLDSTMERQAYGHVGSNEMEWVKEDLSRVPAGEPVFVFSHHPFKWRGVDVDNGLDLMNLYEGHDVPAFFNGHGHKLEIILYRNTPFIENDALFHRNYVIMEKEGDELRLFVKKIGSPQLQPWFAFSLHAPPFSSFIQSPGQEAEVNGTFKVKIAPATPAGSLFLDRRLILPLTQEDGGLVADAAVAAPGWHALDYFLPGETLPTDEEEVFWPGQPPQLRRYPMGEIYAGLVTDGESVFGGTLGGDFFAVSKAGKVEWEKKLDGAVMAAPAYADGVIFVGTDGGTLYALDASTGKEVWKVKKDAPFTSPPLVSNGAVFLGCGDKRFYAFDERTGNEKWDTLLGDFTEAKGVEDGGSLFVGAWDHAFYALDAATGKILWKDKIGKAIYYSPAITTPLVMGGKIYIASKDYELHALDEKTGSELWSSKVTGGISSPVFWNGMIIVPEVGGTMEAFDMQTGKEGWLQRFHAHFFNASPIVSGENLFIPGVAGSLFALDLATHQQEWELRLSRGFIFSTPVVLNGEIWLGSLDGNLYALSFSHFR